MPFCHPSTFKRLFLIVTEKGKTSHITKDGPQPSLEALELAAEFLSRLPAPSGYRWSPPSSPNRLKDGWYFDYELVWIRETPPNDLFDTVLGCAGFIVHDNGSVLEDATSYLQGRRWFEEEEWTLGKIAIAIVVIAFPILTFVCLWLF
jgi:hypothetical protein